MKDHDIWRPPRLRTAVTDKQERHATWLELFYDLIFVVTVANLAHMLNENPVHNAPGFIFLFMPVWWTWIGTTYYATRFDTDDIGHRLFTLLQMVMVVAMAVSVHDALGRTSEAFALSYCAVRSVLVFQYIIAGRYNPQARPLTRRYAIGFGISSAFWLISVFVPLPWRFLIWLMGMVFDVLTPVLAGRLHAAVPPHVIHLPERFGLFIIIVLGESVAGVVRSLSEQQWSLYGALLGLIGLSIPFSLWWIYFDNMEHISLCDALSKGKITVYQIWIYAHLPLAIGITSLAVGVEHVIPTAAGYHLSVEKSLFLCGSSALAMMSLGILCATSWTLGTDEKAGLKPGHVFLSAALILLVGALGGWLSPISLVLSVALLCTIPIASHIHDVLKTKDHVEQS